MKKLLISIILFSNIYANDKIDVNLKNLSIMELIKITSETLNKNILLSSPIEGKINFISNKPIKKDSLLEILELSLNDYGYELKNKNEILQVIKKEELEIKKEEKEKKEKSFSRKSIKFHSQVISLENSKASDISKILKSLNIFPKGKLSIAIDNVNNLLILAGDKKSLTYASTLIKNLDLPKTQVFVKAKIIEIDDNLLDEVGIKYGILGAKVQSGNIYTFSSSLNGGNPIAINTSLIGLDLPNVTSSIALGASINLLNKTYALDIISEPSILCINNQESSIYVGETISIQTGSTLTDGGSVVNSFKREDIGLTLKVKPRISKNRVYLDINTILEGVKNFDSLSSNPNTNKKEIQTTAIVNNGESVVLGGLIESKNENSIEKVPLASDIPLIGELFKNRLSDRRSKNLVVIITPYIIPKSKDISYVRSELSKLKVLEDEYLKRVLNKLRDKKEVEKKVEQSDEVRRKQILQEYFNL